MEIQRLVQDYYQPVYRYAFRLTGSADDSEDLVQQVFLAAHSRLDQLRDPTKAGAWLYGILRGCVGKYYRKRRPVSAVALDLDLDGLPEKFHDSPIDQQQLQTALNDLPPDFRTVLLMFYFEDLSYQEIARTLDIPIGTVMSRLARAKTHLRSRLQAADDESPQE